MQPAAIRKDYYVYALFREDGATPFYIGMGCRDRINQHERKRSLRNRSTKNFIIKKILRGSGCLQKAKLFKNLTREEAASKEKQLIENIGRIPDGPLVNLTDGGDSGVPAGWSHTPEAKKRMRESQLRRSKRSDNPFKGKKHTEETKIKMREKAKGRVSGLGVKGFPVSSETRLKISIYNKGRPKSPESIQRRKDTLAKNKLIREQERQEI